MLEKNKSHKINDLGIKTDELCLRLKTADKLPNDLESEQGIALRVMNPGENKNTTKEIETCASKWSKRKKGNIRISKDELKKLASAFFLDNEKHFGKNAWEIFYKLKLAEFRSELDRVSYPADAQLKKNFLEYLDKYSEWKGTISPIPYIEREQTRFGMAKNEPTTKLYMRHRFQIELKIDDGLTSSSESHLLMFAILPSQPHRSTVCLVPSPLVPDTRITINKKTLPTHSSNNSGILAFEVVPPIGDWTLVTIISTVPIKPENPTDTEAFLEFTRPVSCEWLNKARIGSELHCPTNTELDSLINELERLDGAKNASVKMKLFEYTVLPEITEEERNRKRRPSL